MSTVVDNKVVEMTFDNKQFESATKESLGTLQRLKQALNLKGASTGLENVGAAAKKVDVSGISAGVENVKMKFSAMQVMAITALSNITNSALNTAKRISSALTIQPIKDGFSEYELQMNSVQTIMANTGDDVKTVNSALDELNNYADLTIYNFAEMTRNAGTFTAALGKGSLDKTMVSLKGIGNWAAYAGASSSDMARATFQLGQALASGSVRLQDWMSIEHTAGMAGQNFQNAFKETAKEHGANVDAMIEKNGSFRESLREGWLTTDVFMETMKKFAENEDMTKAATQVKTFSQLIDTTKEALGTGWATVWRTIVGDFEEAREMWTQVNDVISGKNGIVTTMSNARQALWQGWADQGGRTMAIEAISNAFQGLVSVVKPIHSAFREIFPKTTSDQLVDITKRLRDLTAGFKLNDTQSENLKNTFNGLFSVVKLGTDIVKAFTKPFLAIFTSKEMGGIADNILALSGAIGKMLSSFTEGIGGAGLEGISQAMTGSLSVLAELINGITGGLTGLTSLASKAGSFIGAAFDKAFSVIGKGLSWISDNVSAGDIFAGLMGAGAMRTIKKIGDAFDKVNRLFKKDRKSIKGGNEFQKMLYSLHKTLVAFTNGIKVASFVGIAGGVALLTSALQKIAEIKPDKIAYSLVTIRLMIGALNKGFLNLIKALRAYKGKGILQASVALIAMSKAVNMLASAIEKMGAMSPENLAKGLVGIGVSLGVLVKAINSLDASGVGLRTSIAMLALAEACGQLADALVKFGSMSWGEIARGLTAMGGALGEFVASLSVLQKTGGVNSLLGSVGILIGSKALDDIADAMKKFGSMSWGEIKKGLTAMGAALGEFTVSLSALGKLSGIQSIFAGGAILIAVQSLDEISDALYDLSVLTWSEIGRGLTAMGGALAEVSVITGALGNLSGLSGIVGAGSLLIAVQSLKPLTDGLQVLASMSWSEIGKGLTAMNAGLAGLATITGTLGKLAGLSGVVGAGTILLTVQSLEPLATALQKFSSMSWSEIGQGLTAMGAALTELAVVSGAVGSLSGIAGLVGAGTIDLAAQGLDKLATALQKFGSMSWSEIGQGLSAMGAAMSETALGGLLNTFSGFGANAIATVAEPLGSLADSIKKWSGVKVPDDIGSQLGTLATGILKFTFGGFGADALSKAAPGVGSMANSVKKWSGVTVPDGLSSGLKDLADGVKAFSWAFMGGFSLGTITGPLGKLAGSVNKWNGVTIPANIKQNLSDLASGVKAFSWAFMGGFSIGETAGPLGKLASAVSKWSNIKVPATIKADLNNIADGVKSFSLLGGLKLSGIAGPLGTLASAVKKFAAIDTNSGKTLKAFAKDIKSTTDTLSGINSGSVNNASIALTKLVQIMKKVSSVNAAKVGQFVTAANKLNKINVTGVKVDTGGLSSAVSSVQKTMSSMSRTMSSSKSSISSAMTTATSGAASAVKSQSKSVTSAGKALVKALAKSISSGKSSVTKAAKDVASNAGRGVSSNKKSFTSAGRNLGDGLVIGIRGKFSAAYSAGYQLGRKAVEGEKAGQNSNSPSKDTIKAGGWLGEGLIIGMQKMGQKVQKSGRSMGTTATQAISSAVSRVSELANSDMEVHPTIRPVVDLTGVSAGANHINGILSMTPSIETLANVSDIRNRMSHLQNGNSDVVSAIKGLEKRINGISGDTYNVNGVTYDDGTNITDAVKTLIRAARIERRV